MSEHRNQEYIPVSDENNTGFYCPESVLSGQGLRDEWKAECVEKDVVERYAGDIAIRK